jgi:adenosine deaminase
MLVNLHAHLEGWVRPETAAELAAEAGLPRPPGGWAEALQLDGPSDLTGYLAKVAATYPMFGTAEGIARIAGEAVEDAAADGLDYLELRFGPATHARAGLRIGDVVRAVCAGVADASRRTGLLTGVIVCALRHHGPEINNEVAAAAASFAGSGVVGFDLAGDESRFPALEPYVAAFRIAGAAGLGLTCHAAEAGPAAAAREAVERFGVSRIGHAVHLAQDPATLAWCRDHGVVIECCPTSNLYTGAVTDLAAHPIRTFRDSGIAVALGDDNPVQTGSPLSRERRVLREVLGFTEADLADLDRVSVGAAFADHRTRAVLAARLAGD